MAGFSQGAIELKKKNSISAAPNDFIKLSINTDNIPYTVDENGVYRYLNYYDTAGISSYPLADLIDNGDGTCSILSATARLYSTNNFTGNILEYSIPSATFTLTDGAEQYICVSYNSGTPIFYLVNDKKQINESNMVCVYCCWRQGNEIHSIGSDSKALGLSNKISLSITDTIPYRKSIDGGLILSESIIPNPRTVLITSANVYAGVIRNDIQAFDSSIDRLTLAYHSGGNWLYQDNLIYNNTQYDDGTNLQTIGNNKYAVRWFYRSIGDIKQTFYVLGLNQYNNISDARLENPRSDLPIVLRKHCILIARIIIQYNASSGLVENVTDIKFETVAVQNHNDLANIQGGSVGNYYHVSANTFSYLSAVSADIQEQLNSKVSSAGSPSNHNNLLNLQGGSSGNYYHVSASTFGYLSAVSADIQEQINSKADISAVPTISDLNSFLPLSGGTLTGLLSGTKISISDGISANSLSIPNAKIIPGTRQHSIKLVGNDGPYTEYTSTIGFGIDDRAVVGTLDGNSLYLSGSHIELNGANSYVKGNLIVGEFGETNSVVLQDWGILDQRGDAIFDGTLSAKNGIIIPGKTSADILLADGNTINLSDIEASNYYSTGVIDGSLAEIYDTGAEYFTVNSCNVALYPNPDFTGKLQTFSVAGGDFYPDDGEEQYLCVSYNGGNPVMYLENSWANINESSIIRLYTIWRQGWTIHSIGTDSKGIGLSNKAALMEDCTIPYRRTIDGGLVLSETSSPIDRIVTVTSGNVYAGVIRIPVSAMSSYTDTLTLAYKNSGVWTYNNMPAYNNTQYSDGTNLQYLGVAKYSPRWFYRSIGDTKQLFYVMGGQYNTVAEAKGELPPGDLSKIVKNHCILIARIIIQQNAASGIVDNISDTNLNFSSVQNHNDLGNIQGGSIGNYYHVSATTFGYLSGVSADIQEQINSKADISAVQTISDLNSFLPLSGGTMGGIISARDLVPASSFTYDLGKTGQRWGSLFCRVLTANAISTTNYDLTSRIKLILGDADNVGTGGQMQFRKRSTYYAPYAVSGDFYSDGNNLHFYDESKTPRTLAYTSDVANYLPLSGGTLYGQMRGTSVSASGNISASSFVKFGGTSSQFLKANGSVDSTSYIPTSGGTLPTASSLILSTTAVDGDKTIAVRGDVGFDVGIFTKSGRIFIGPEIETSEPTRIFSPVSAFGNISATSFIKTAYTSATGTFSTLSNSNTADNIIIAASSSSITADVNNNFLGRTFNVLCLKNFNFSFNASTSAYYNGNVYNNNGFSVAANNHISLTQIAPNIIICK